MSLRVLVVDDTALFRRIVSQALLDVPGVEVVGTASNGRMALARIPVLQPDLITLDIEMPEMNGIEFLEATSQGAVSNGAAPCAASHCTKAGVIVLSSRTTRGAQMTLRALELGAFEFVAKPESSSVEESIAVLRGQLIPIIRAFERKREIQSILRTGHLRDAGPPVRTAPSELPAARPHRGGRPFVLVAVSTGGPNALARFLPQLPADLGAPVFIVQHMPALFTAPLAASLTAKSVLKVTEAVDGELAQTNRVYLAPGGKHMKLAAGPGGEIVIRITDDPPEHNYKPCADYLFRSAALNFPGRAITVILTGMGSDGTEGLKLLKRGGCFSIAQDEASCVVFGMPKEAIATGLVDQISPIDQVAGAVVHSVREGRP